MKKIPGQLEVTDHDRGRVGLTYVYPVVSRRAGGVSIGINLNPNNACNWHCVYCQVPDLKRGAAPPIDLHLLESELGGFIRELQQGEFMQTKVPDGVRQIVDVAFSGNGEPTSSHQFAQVIECAGNVMRETGLQGEVPLRLITNGSLLAQAPVQEGIALLGQLGGEVWFKVDAGTAQGMRRINSVELSPVLVEANLRRCTQLCRTWVQTCLFAWDGCGPDDAELKAYTDLLLRVGAANLAGVHLYGLARPSMQESASRLASLPVEQMEGIAERLRAQGLLVKVSP